MSKRILIFKGSPKKKGNSSTLADQAAEAAKKCGAEVIGFDLHTMKIQPCRACDACHTAVDRKCVIQDDMQLIYPECHRADAILIASPVYYFTLAAQVKLCIDRWYALETSHGNVLSGKPFGLILSYGDTDPYTSGAINAIRTMQDICRYFHSPLLDVVYGTGLEVGEIQAPSEWMEKAYRLGETLAKS